MTELATRGTSNKNKRGSSYDVRNRKNFLLATYAADISAIRITYSDVLGPTNMRGKVEVYYPERQHFQNVLNTQHRIMDIHGYLVKVEVLDACRCYRCGKPLIFETLTVDRIVPGCVKTAEFPNGGTYKRSNIRPACGPCNSETGGALATGKKYQPLKRPRRLRVVD